MKLCPCGSGLELETCCGPVVEGERPAATAEALMRARYAAYTLGRIDFLGMSLHPEARHDYSEAATRKWARQAQWLGLEIVSVEGGGDGDSQGKVEFVAHYRERGIRQAHHEVGIFERYEGLWFYLRADQPKSSSRVRSQPKVGRNDPCPCGSGLKFKKCCGVAGTK